MRWNEPVTRVTKKGSANGARVVAKSAGGARDASGRWCQRHRREMQAMQVVPLEVTLRTYDMPPMITLICPTVPITVEAHLGCNTGAFQTPPGRSWVKTCGQHVVGASNLMICMSWHTVVIGVFWSRDFRDIVRIRRLFFVDSQ